MIPVSEQDNGDISSSLMEELANSAENVASLMLRQPWSTADGPYLVTDTEP